MRISDIQVIGGSLVLATPADVEALKNELWIAFPKSYREYVTKLGEGELGSFVRIYPPWRIRSEQKEWRSRIDKYWFWDRGRKVLPKERALECVIIGDTTTGDELIFHPCRAHQLFVLPRESEEVFLAGSDLLTAIDWICTSGQIEEPFAERDFKPFDSRLEGLGKEQGETTSADPSGESLDDLVEAAKRWAERHDVRKKASKELKEYTDKTRKVVLVSECIEFAGKGPHAPGYVALYHVVDKAHGREVGVVRRTMSDGSLGHEYKPVK
jgi:hypothetical protein